MLNFDRPLFHPQSAAIPRVGVAEHSAAPIRNEIGLRRTRGRARCGRDGTLSAWTLLGHADGYTMENRDGLPSEFNGPFASRNEQDRIRARRVPKAWHP